MGKNKINFKRLYSTTHNTWATEANMMNVLNNISCEKFVNYVRHYVHMSIEIRDGELPSYAAMKDIKEYMFPDLSKKTLSKIYYYWREGKGISEDTLAYTISGFPHIYRGKMVYVSLMIGFRINPETKKPYLHTEYSCRLNGEELTSESVQNVLSKIYEKIDKIFEEYEAQKQNNAELERQLKLEKKITKAPVIKMKDLEKLAENPNALLLP